MFQLIVSGMSIALVSCMGVASVFYGTSVERSRTVANARPAIVEPARSAPREALPAPTPLERAAAAHATAPGEFVTVDGR